MEQVKNNIPNVPQLRFREFSGDWERKKLEEITTWYSGGTPAKDIDSYWNGEIPWISASSMRGLEYNSSELKITHEGLKNGSRLAKKGSLLLLVRGSMLFNTIPIGIAMQDVAFNQDVKAIEISNLSTSKYILYWFIASEPKLMNLVTGTGIGAGKLDLPDLKSLDISLPTLPEQTRIANFLTATDEKLQALRKKKNLLEQYKKGVMQQIFSRQIRFRDENGAEFGDWEEKKLGEVGDFKNGLNKGKEDFGFGFPFINLMDVFGKSNIVNGVFGLVNASKKELKDYNLNVGDVLFIRSSVKIEGVGETVVVLEELPDTVFSGFLIRFRERENLMNIVYKKYCFKTVKFRNQILSVSTTSANTNINQESLNSLTIPLPTLPEQTRIANFLTALDEKIHQCQAQIERMEVWKKGLLQQLFV